LTNVILIKFSEDLQGVTPEQSRLLNRMREGMEYREWRVLRDQVMFDDDYDTLDRMDKEYELIVSRLYDLPCDPL
jgi:predicted NAD-dependent protein-ADP-ribosyltransferase YbiA (DUF1768 family)